MALGDTVRDGRTRTTASAAAEVPDPENCPASERSGCNANTTNERRLFNNSHTRMTVRARMSGLIVSQCRIAEWPDVCIRPWDLLSNAIMDFHRVYIGLGSNLREPENQVRMACTEIAALPGVRLRCCSSLHRTAPVGYADQPDFINAVAELRTALAPLRLLEALRAIEAKHGRIREFRNGPRTLDLDILIYGDLQLSTDELVLPHPRAHLRAFVLLPLVEIAPDCVIPGLGPARTWLNRCDGQSVRRIDFPPAADRDRALEAVA
jgi:2-amino-4-hydroxy-6-hydroxymethyldihydropteridine diphosphokinase